MLSVIDSHVHLWDTDTLHYPWLDEFPILRAPHLRTDFDREARVPQSLDCVIGGAVVVQADVEPDQAIREVDMLAALPGVIPIVGIVAYAPLHAGATVDGHLAELRERPLVKAVRDSVQNDATGILRSPEYLAGLLAAADRGLTIDMCARAEQLPQLLSTLREVTDQRPGVHLVIDHAGKPPIRDRSIRSWARDLAALAELPGVFCKLSGLVTETDTRAGGISQVLPYIDTILNTFGASRTLFGSDWPVVNLESGYADWFGAVEGVVTALSPAEKALIFRATAVEVYRLELSAAPSFSPLITES